MDGTPQDPSCVNLAASWARDAVVEGTKELARELQQEAASTTSPATAEAVPAAHSSPSQEVAPEEADNAYE